MTSKKSTKPYFSHDEGARKDPKLIGVLMRLGHEGKSVYWDLVEMLYEQGGYLSISQYQAYAFDLRTSEKVIKSLVADFGLFKKDRQRFWSDSVLLRMSLRNEKAQRRALAGAKGGKAKAKNLALLEQNPSNATANEEQTQSNALPSKLNESKTTDVVGAAPSPSSVVAGQVAADGTPTYTADTFTALNNANVFMALCMDLKALRLPMDLDFEYYRESIKRKVRDKDMAVPATTMRNFIETYFSKEKRNGLITLSADLPTVPTPKHEIPEPGKERPGQVIAFECENDEVLMRNIRTARLRTWPTAIIHFIHPR